MKLEKNGRIRKNKYTLIKQVRKEGRKMNNSITPGIKKK